MSKRLMILVALTSRATHIKSPAVPSRVKTLLADVKTWRNTRDTAEDVLLLLKSVRAFDKCNRRFDDLLDAIFISEKAGVSHDISAHKLELYANAARVPVAKPELYTGKQIGEMLDAERITALNMIKE